MEYENYELQGFNSKSLPKLRYRKRVQRIKSKFLRGPIPLDWLQAAMKLGGAAISVGIIVWFYGGMTKTVSFKIGIQDIAKLIGRSWLTAKRGFLMLEQGGLISVERQPGRKHWVEIRDVDFNESLERKEVEGGKEDGLSNGTETSG